MKDFIETFKKQYQYIFLLVSLILLVVSTRLTGTQKDERSIQVTKLNFFALIFIGIFLLNHFLTK
jgi:predicted tellurium resistance membrane protein TerC